MFGVDEFVFGAPQPEEVSQRQQEQDGHPPKGMPQAGGWTIPWVRLRQEKRKINDPLSSDFGG